MGDGECVAIRTESRTQAITQNCTNVENKIKGLVAVAFNLILWNVIIITNWIIVIIYHRNTYRYVSENNNDKKHALRTANSYFLNEQVKGKNNSQYKKPIS